MTNSPSEPMTIQKIFDQKHRYMDQIGIAPVAVYLGTEEYRQLLSDPDVRRYANLVRKDGETLYHTEVLNLRIYRVRLDSHFGFGFDSTSQRRDDSGVVRVTFNPQGESPFVTSCINQLK